MRDSRGRFTRRSRAARLLASAAPVEGTEVNGVVSGEPIVLGGAEVAETEAVTRTRATKS
jgi:hypothetical protein